MYANNITHQKITVKLSVNIATVDTKNEIIPLMIKCPRR